MAMTCVTTKWYELSYHSPTKQNKFELHLTCTFDTTPGTAVATLDTDQMNLLDGKYLYTVTSVPGSTAPTDNSDLQISDSRGLLLLDPAGTDPAASGLNFIDATTVKQVYFKGPNGSQYPLINKAWALTFTVTNNAVNNSIVHLYIQVVE